MGKALLARHFAGLQGASTPVIAVAAVGSFAGQVAAVVQAAPLWLYVVAALAPWLPILAVEIIWTARHFRWLALFCLLVLTQSMYLFEQVARVVQATFLGRAVADATGIFGALGIDRIELLWTSWAVFGLVLLLTRFPRNPWLWATLAVASADVLLLPFGIVQPVLRLVVSVLEIAALNLAFAFQLGRTYDAWLARAFPQLPERMLIEASDELEEIRLRPGERVEQDPQRWYIVTRGTGMLVRMGPGGHEILLRLLGPGQVVRDVGTVAADTALELLAVPTRQLAA